MNSPTAQTSLVETAVTPFRKPACLGALTRRQLVPFQCSMSGGVAVLTFPTAQTSVVETAATPRRASFELALGLATALHAVPFQCSVSVCWLVSPTAQTSLAEMLATPLRSLTDPGLGLETTVQAAACATAGARSRAISTAPTRHEKRRTFKRFMILLSSSCSQGEQVTLRQAETRRQGDAIPACQHDDQSLATIRRYASSQRIAEGAQTLGIELGERLNSVACVLEYSHAPGLSGAGVRRSRVKDVEARAGVGAGDDAPRGAVPLFDHRLLDPAADHRPHRPDVVGGDDDDASELPGAWASDDAPRGAVPVFDQGLHCAAGSTGLSHGPDLIRRDRSCGLQGVEPRADAGAGDDAPRGAVPVF